MQSQIRKKMDSRLRGNDIRGRGNDIEEVGNDILHPHPTLSPQGRGKRIIHPHLILYSSVDTTQDRPYVNIKFDLTGGKQRQARRLSYGVGDRYTGNLDIIK